MTMDSEAFCLSMTGKRISEVILKHYPEVVAIYLYGSLTTDYAKPDSDVDIGILFPKSVAKSVGSLKCSSLQTELESICSRPVDLSNLRAVSTILQKEVLAAETLIFSADENARIEFEMTVLSDYQKLNEERSEIIKSIQKDGIVVAQ